ncbi:MAG TPA: nitrilase-related carbon-nitrogen hydrolase, partial [Gaiellaceae bacterium]
MKLALAQIDPTVGDLEGNRNLILARIEEARAAGADLVVLPELAVTGYPPEDLLLRPGFVRAARASLDRVAAGTRGLVALVGAPLFDGELYNACAICADGEVTGWAKKRHLPNYGVFDEKRYFASSDELALVDVAGTRVGITICEDMWVAGPPTTELVSAGAELVVNLSASPFHVGRAQEREAIFAARARENGVRVALCN